jgi:signal transduction histidine kinase
MTSQETRTSVDPPVWLKLGALAGPAGNFGIIKVAAAARTLTQLHDQAHVVRAELARLREELARTQDDLSAAQGASARLAKEQLVLAAERAKAIADTARESLGALALAAAGRPGTEDDLRVEVLRQENAQLLRDAEASRVEEADAQAEHARQITFLAMVAHELRNPLLPLRLAAQMLAQARTDDIKFAGLQATIAGQVAHMGRLIGDLLDGSRVSAGKFRLERSIIDFGDVLHTAIETVQPAMAERKHSFSFTPPAGTLCVHGDAMRLVQAFVNLLENAAKYTPEGGAISLVAAPRSGMIEITIADNGIGISAQALPHVFELFVQDQHAVAVSREGLGIGLAVVRDLVEAHGGSVVASSAGLGHGSEFVVLLPLLAAAGGTAKMA